MEVGILLLIKKGYLTGWLVAAPIGPVNLEIIRRGLRDRLAAGFCVGLGAVCIDMIYFTVFALGFGALLETPLVNRVLLAGGGTFLCFLGLGAIGDAVRFLRRDSEGKPPAATVNPPARAPLLRSYVTGLAMTGVNPMTIAFWSALALEFAALPLRAQAIAVLAVMAGCLSWVLTLMVILRFARSWIGPRLFATVTLAGAAVMLYFGSRFLWRAIAGA